MGEETFSQSQIVVYASPDSAAAPIARVSGGSNMQIVGWSSRFTAVQLHDGRRGYVDSQFIQFAVKILELKQDNVQMRQSASAASLLKATLPKGVLIEQIGDELGAEGKQWIPIRSPHGQTGYIAADCRMAPPSRLYWLRLVPRRYFWNLWLGVPQLLVGLVITSVSLLSIQTGRGGWIIFYYGPIFTGGAQITLAVTQLREQIAIQRRKHRERFI